MSNLDATQLLATIGVPIQIFFIDMLLNADNALMIALACRALPPAEMRQAAFLGTAAAIVMRVLMAAVVLWLLEVPFLKVAAGAVLLGIALKLTLERDAASDQSPGRRARTNLLGAVAAIVVADAVMSLDNVIAIAVVAQGSLLLLSFGLLLSVPMLVYGSALIRRVLHGGSLLVLAAGMFLGWIAGGIAVSDPVVAPWVATSAPALVVAVPFACAIFVLWENRILSAAHPGEAELAPLHAPHVGPEGGLDAGG